MKRLRLMMLFALMNVAVFAQETEVTNGAQIEFDKLIHEYGEVIYDGDGICYFEFKNTGNAPLIISDATGSCGCTVPSYPKEPIAPGQSATITVKYNTKKPGAINRTVTITSNAVNESIAVLRVKGNVLAKPAPTTPIDTSGAPVK